MFVKWKNATNMGVISNSYFSEDGKFVISFSKTNAPRNRYWIFHKEWRVGAHGSTEQETWMNFRKQLRKRMEEEQKFLDMMEETGNNEKQEN